MIRAHLSNCGAVQLNMVTKLDKSDNSGSPNIAPIINSISKCNQPRVFLHVPLGCIVHPHKRPCFSSMCTTCSILQDVSVRPQKSSDTAWSILASTPTCCQESWRWWASASCFLRQGPSISQTICKFTHCVTEDELELLIFLFLPPLSEGVKATFTFLLL